MGIIRAEKDLIGAHCIIDELDECGSYRASSVVIDLLEIFFRLSFAFGISFAPVEPVEIEQDHPAEVGRDEPEIRVAVEDSIVNDSGNCQSAVCRPENFLMQ